MKVILGALAALLFVVSVQGCCTPDQWEGGFGEVAGSYEHRKPHLLGAGGKLSYDATNKRIASQEEAVVDGKVWKFKIIADFSAKTIYAIYKDGSKCRKYKMKREFQKFCIPANATSQGDHYFGAGDDKLAFTSYDIHFKGGHAYCSVTKKGCIPVGETLVGKFKKVAALVTVGYMDVTAGIADPKVFDPPASCKNATTEYEEPEHFRNSVFLNY